MTVHTERLNLLDTVHLDTGGHDSIDDGACVMELASYIAGEPFSDHPKCVSRVLTNYAIGLNDDWGDAQRQKLKPFIPRMIGTDGDGQDEARGWLAIDWLIRTYTPAWLGLAGLTAEARALRDLRRITDRAAWTAQRQAVAQRVAAAGWAAYSVADSAAGWAADSAAFSAAYSAAYSAVYSAAYSALQPTVETLQASALDLLDRMINPGAVTQ